ncbi:MAG: Gfo/Idh/MocA family oxidoreductase [Vallitaleaceae bacterium]|nr:Gfo/Idh/MocA family oxidoreductase [Vallitaleaceae bacterium]
MKKIRFAVVGTNFITKRFLEAAYLLNQFEFAAVYSRDLNRGRAFIHDLESVRVFDCFDDLVNSKDIDAVYIASPTYCHASQSILLIENGKHVLCEKPIASNLFEWKNMIHVANENKKIILEAMRPLFTPAYQIIKENLIKIGPIRKVNFNFCQYSSRYDNFKAGIIENAFKPELSNGALMDIGVYCVAVLVSLFGKPINISANGYILPKSIDAMGNIIALYNGMEANLVYSKITNSELPCEIQGEKGTLYFEQIVSPKHMRIKYNDGHVEMLPEAVYLPYDMVYAIEAFTNMINGKSIQDEYNRITTNSMEVIDEARKQIGIIYPADLL